MSAEPGAWTRQTFLFDIANVLTDLLLTIAVFVIW